MAESHTNESPGTPGRRNGKKTRNTAPQPAATAENGLPATPARRRGARQSTSTPRTRGRKATAATEAVSSVEELRATQAQAQALRDQHQQAEALLEEARRQTGQVRQHLEETGHDLEVAREFVEKTRKQSQEAGAKFQEANGLLDLARQRADETRRDLPGVEQQVQESRRQLEEARQECGRAHESLQGVEQEAARIRVHLEEVRAAVREEAAQVRERFEEVRRELTTAQQEAAILRRQVEVVRQLREELDRVVRERQQAPPETPAALSPPSAGAVAQPMAVTATPAPADPGQEVIYARVRAETRQERLTRYLHEAWAVENSLEETFRKMSEEVIDPDVKTLFDTQRHQCREQRERLGQRIRDLGGTPSGGTNPFSRLVASIWEALQRTPDDFDRSTQDLMKGFAAGQFCAAMYQALEAYAAAAEDAETSLLAAQARQRKQEASNEAWLAITPKAIRPAQVDLLATPPAPEDVPPEPPAEEVVSVREVEVERTNTVPPEAGVP
jgi:ferritin-like metal-binding protein YciE